MTDNTFLWICRMKAHRIARETGDSELHVTLSAWWKSTDKYCAVIILQKHIVQIEYDVIGNKGFTQKITERREED